MGIRPDLLKLQLMQDMQNQQQAPQQMAMRNPIGEGSLAGIQAAKRSLQLTEQENKGALGAALMQFASGKNLPPPGSGLAGALGTINAGFLPAMQAYDSERDRITKENYALMQHEEEVRRHAAQEEWKRMQFEEQKRLHDAQIASHHASIAGTLKEEQERDRWKEIEGGLEPGVEVIEKFRAKPSEWNFVNKDIESTIEQGNYAREGISILDELDKIIDESPGLYNKMDYILLNNYNHDPSFLTQKAIEAKVPKKDIANFQRAAKLTADLFALEAKSIPARGINMFMEKQLRQKVPDIKMAPDAFKPVSARMRKKFKSTYENAAKKSEYAQRGLWYRNKIKPLEEEKQQEIYDTQDKPVSAMSSEELMAAIANRRQELGLE